MASVQFCVFMVLVVISTSMPAVKSLVGVLAYAQIHGVCDGFFCGMLKLFSAYQIFKV
jgi:hypothetical protein